MWTRPVVRAGAGGLRRELHELPRANGGLSLAAPGSWANLVEVPAQASAGTRVVPNDSAGSVLFRRVTGDGFSVMPPPPGAPLSAAAIEASDTGGLSVSFTHDTSFVDVSRYPAG